MDARRRAGIGIAVIRMVVEPGPRPVIRILQMGELFRDEHVLGVTTSVDEASQIIRDWLADVLGRYAPSGDRPDRDR